MAGTAGSTAEDVSSVEAMMCRGLSPVRKTVETYSGKYWCIKSSKATWHALFTRAFKGVGTCARRAALATARVLPPKSGSCWPGPGGLFPVEPVKMLCIVDSVKLREGTLRQLATL